MKNFLFILTLSSLMLFSCRSKETRVAFDGLQEYDILLPTERNCISGGLFDIGSNCTGEDALYYFCANQKNVYRHGRFDDFGGNVIAGKIIHDELWLSVDSDLNMLIVNPASFEIKDRFSTETTVKEIIELKDNRVLLRNKIYDASSKELLHEIEEDLPYGIFVNVSYLDDNIYIQSYFNIMIYNANTYDKVTEIDISSTINIKDVSFSKDHYYLSVYDSDSRSSKLLRLPRSNPSSNTLESIEVDLLNNNASSDITIIGNTAYINNMQSIFAADLSDWVFEPTLTNNVENINHIARDHINKRLYIQHRSYDRNRLTIVNPERKVVSTFELNEAWEGLEKIIVL